MNRAERGASSVDFLIVVGLMAAAWAAIVVFGSVGAPERVPAFLEAQP